MRVTVTMNGIRREFDVEPHLTLAEVIRGRTDCPDGTCGACTVLLNGEEIRSCLFLGVQCHGAEVHSRSVPQLPI